MLIKDLTPKDIGRSVQYIPFLNCDLESDDYEYGHITSFNDEYVFVDYGKNCGIATNPEDLRFINLKNKTIFNKKEYQKQYYLKHKKRLLAKNKKYRLENPDKIKAISKAYRLENRDELNAKVRKYRSDPKNIERLKAQARGYRLKKQEDEYYFRNY